MEIVLGAVVGVASSLVAWLVINHALRPKLLISPFISRTNDENGDEVYRIKLVNGRRRRDVVDVEIAASYWVRGFFENRPRNRKNVTLPTHPDRIMGMNRNWIVRLDISEMLVGLEGYVRDFDGPLEALLSLGDDGDTRVRFWVTYSDGYSGLRRTTHHDYRTRDLLPHFFEAGASVSIGRHATSAPSPNLLEDFGE